jgi:hypothetical protein
VKLFTGEGVCMEFPLVTIHACSCIILKIGVHSEVFIVYVHTEDTGIEQSS